MIRINGTTVQFDDDNENLALMNKEEIDILQTMASHQDIYEYDSFEQLLFELKMRIETIVAAEELNRSGARFATFETSFCNEEYWDLIETGAFVLKDDTSPAEAVLDIYSQGDKYAFECATAMVIVFYKAAVESVGKESFDHLFADLVLYDWHYDKDIGLMTTRGNEFIPGDCIYFKNPDFDPETPYWRGENAIVINEDLYYGHGIGIKNATEIIEHLNNHRKTNATESAYILSQHTRPDYRTLSNYSLPQTRSAQINLITPVSQAFIGSNFYIF
ncbi:protein-glutamine gamma-glutamyltransferase [Bacillus sp. PS06]|uniref:protein-glutamine gamma-glutamyltransferase n=1 Tax=Bacillus sp. PS06 TaxID=2764176 RepID=UPI00177E1F9C|nr:protein-glutamine gamma-glutamyltransferase [Bacillus sp. PS06]MBD8070537.1 protein-glutamine gamma-glutamyltransferase [Bacillus sp. PS06]